VQHQPVGADFPAFQPIQKAHAEQIGLHLSARHHERRHRTLDELADRETIKRQPGSFGVTAGRLDVYKDGRPAGSATYAPRASRFVGAEEAIEGMVDRLFPRWRP